jgi:hypothetical protein
MAEDLDRYAAGMKEVYDPLWERGGRERYLESLRNEDKPEVHARMGRKAPNGHLSGNGAAKKEGTI